MPARASTCDSRRNAAAGCTEMAAIPRRQGVAIGRWDGRSPRNFTSWAQRSHRHICGDYGSSWNLSASHSSPVPSTRLPAPIAQRLRRSFAGRDVGPPARVQGGGHGRHRERYGQPRHAGASRARQPWLSTRPGHSRGASRDWSRSSGAMTVQRLATSLERASKHPLAAAVVEGARARGSRRRPTPSSRQRVRSHPPVQRHQRRFGRDKHGLRPVPAALFLRVGERMGDSHGLMGCSEP
jgi:hypothetical protein